MGNQSVVTKRKNECWAGIHNRCSLHCEVRRTSVLCLCVPKIQLQNKELLLFPNALTFYQQSQNI